MPLYGQPTTYFGMEGVMFLHLLAPRYPREISFEASIHSKINIFSVLKQINYQPSP